MYPETVVFNKYLGYLQVNGTFNPHLKSGRLKVFKSAREVEEFRDSIIFGNENFEFIQLGYLTSMQAQFVYSRSPKAGGEP